LLLQDFKEAGRLAAESKSLAAEAEAASTRARDLRAQASGLEAKEAATVQDVARLEADVEAAKRLLALSRWHRLQVSRKQAAIHHVRHWPRLCFYQIACNVSIIAWVGLHTQATVIDTRLQIEAAVAGERYSEADSLQAEHEAALQDAQAIASVHGFTKADLGEELLATQAACQKESAAEAKGLSSSQPVGASSQSELAGVRAQNEGTRLGAPSKTETIEEHLHGPMTGDLHQNGMQLIGASRQSVGAQSASHMATNSSGSVRSLSLTSDCHLSDAEPQQPSHLPSAKAAGEDAARRQQQQSERVLRAISSREALREAGLDRQFSEGDAASGYMADSDSVRDRPLRQGSHSSIDSLNLAGSAAVGILRAASSAGTLDAASVSRALEDVILHDRARGEQALEPKERGGQPLRAGELTQHQQEEDRMSTAATVGGDSTRWGGSDAVAVEGSGSVALEDKRSEKADDSGYAEPSVMHGQPSHAPPSRAEDVHQAARQEDIPKSDPASAGDGDLFSGLTFG
jgi:hypothetical protein